MALDDADFVDGDIEDDVADIIYVLDDSQEETSSDVQPQISPVQFLRDRELGIRGTSERVVRQGVVIQEDLVKWPYHASRKVYTWVRDNLCTFDDEDCDVLDGCMSAEKKYKQAEKIAYYIGSALYIKIPAGNGKCIELMMICNDRSPAENPVLKWWFDNDNFREYFKCLEQWNQAPCFYELQYIVKHCRVQDIQRYCNSCKRNTCKCSEEACDTY